MLTASQLQTFKTAITTDPNVAAWLTAGDDADIANYYNQASSPAVNVWRPSITVSELNTAIDWSATGFAGLSVAKQNTYFAMTQGGSVDATSSNIRTGFGAVFGSGTTTTNALTALAQRVATKFEALFTTSGVCSLFGYVVTSNDVASARNS